MVLRLSGFNSAAGVGPRVCRWFEQWFFVGAQGCPVTQRFSFISDNDRRVGREGQIGGKEIGPRGLRGELKYTAPSRGSL